MPLQRQEKEIALNGGMDVKQSTELQDETSLRSVVNLRWDALRELRKRPHYASQATPATPAVYPEVAIEALFSRGAEVCALTDGNGVVKVAQDDPTRIDFNLPNNVLGSDVSEQRRACPRVCRVSRIGAERAQSGSNEGIHQIASALYDGTLVLAWTETGGRTTLRVKAIDAATGEVVTPVYSVDVGSHADPLPCITAVPVYAAPDQGVAITYTTDAGAPFEIKVIKWSAGSRIFASGTSLTTNAKYRRHATWADGQTGKFYFGFTDNTSGFVQAQYRTLSAVTSTHNSTVSGRNGIGFVKNSVATLVLSCINTVAGGSPAKAEIFGNPGSVATIATESSSGGFSTEAYQGITAALQGEDAIVYVNCAGRGVVLPRVAVVQLTVGASSFSVAATSYIRNALLTGPGFTMDGRAHCIVSVDPYQAVNESTPRPTSLLVARYYAAGSLARHDTIARISHDRAFMIAGPALPAAKAGDLDQLSDNYAGIFTVSVDGSDVWVTSTADVTRDVSPTWESKVPTTVMLSKLAFGRRPLSSVVVDGTSLVANGATFEYDGDSAFEAGFCGQPRIVRIDSSVGAIGGTTFATEGFVRAVWTYVDAQGHLHRSAPSEPYSTGTFTTQRFMVYVSKPTISALDGVAMAAVGAELYVTEPSGTVYYLALTAGEDYGALIDPSDDHRDTYWLFSDVAEGNTARPQLYSTGDGGQELVAEPAPSFLSVARCVNRVWGVDAEDRSRIWPSKTLMEGFAVEWSSFLPIRVNDDCVAVHDHAGTPTVFAKGGIWQIDGDGPDNTGNGFFAAARRLPYEISCIDGLVCSTPNGTVFRGRNGFYLLGLDSSLTPLGLPLDPSTRSPSTIDYTFARIVFDEPSNEVRILDDFTGRYWVYNLVEGKWSEWSQNTAAQNALDAVVVDGRLWYLHEDADGVRSIRRERGLDEDGVADSGESWSLQIPWLRTDGIAGFGRIWEIWLVFKARNDDLSIYTTALTLTYETKSQRGDATETQSWTGAELDESRNGDVVEIRYKPGAQQCKAFRLSLSETLLGFEGVSPIGVRIVMGVDGKAQRQARASATKGAA